VIRVAVVCLPGGYPALNQAWPPVVVRTMRHFATQPSLKLKADACGGLSTVTLWPTASHLEPFLHVVDQGSITQGAERAHLSLASASARITAMEKALGAKLLERHRRGVVPSPTGVT